MVQIINQKKQTEPFASSLIQLKNNKQLLIKRRLKTIH